MASIVCQICNNTFESRNKLFKHVRVCSTGAAVTQTTSFGHKDVGRDTELYLYVVGGRQRGRTLKSVERYSFSSKEWQECPQMLENRGSHGAGSAAGLLYAVGGGGMRSNLSSCECFDGKEWGSAAPLQVSRHALAVVDAANDTIYAVGGWIDGKECSPVVERFTTASNAWVTVAPLNQARRLHGVAAYPSESGESDLYAFGGNCDDPHWHTNTAEAYSAATDSWRFIAPMPASGGAAAATVLPYVFVFLHGKYVLRYDTRADTYLKLSNLPLPDWHCFDAVAVPGTTQVLLIGGVTNGRWCKKAFSYDASNDSWEQLPSMKTARRRCASAIVRVSAASKAGDASERAEESAADCKKQKTDA